MQGYAEFLTLYHSLMYYLVNLLISAPPKFTDAAQNGAVISNYAPFCAVNTYANAAEPPISLMSSTRLEWHRNCILCSNNANKQEFTMTNRILHAKL